MHALPVIAVFDIGKTNKKVFLFNEAYQVVFEHAECLEETIDEDGFACENVKALSDWITTHFNLLLEDERYIIRGANVSAYGASFVHLDANKKPCLPLYNYLKPYPAALQKQFYDTYGGEETVAAETASPVLGHLNSGMQLYWLRHQRPQAFGNIKYSLHLPQYCSFLLTGLLQSDITSIGCHTGLWNFNTQQYHRWVAAENIEPLLPPVIDSNNVTDINTANGIVNIGGGLHDSSAALIPYLYEFTEPFLLISTGTWCISLNPFNDTPLTVDELKQDCLCYLAHNGKPVKASRLFAGNFHEQQVKKLAAHFNKPPDYYKQIKPDLDLLTTFLTMNDVGEFNAINFDVFSSYEQAYQLLMYDIVQQQKQSSSLVLKGKAVNKIFVDGGFSKNQLYMHWLANAFPGIEVYAATVAQASATGAAMAIHQHWNTLAMPDDIIKLKRYAASV